MCRIARLAPHSCNRQCRYPTKMVRRPTIMDAIVITGIGILCFPVFLYLLPYLEASRSEARLMTAHNETRRLSQSTISEASDGTVQVLSDLDPWDQPYRMVLLDTGQMRVVSSGPNKSYSPTGFDADDIYSDMLDPPYVATARRKQWQIIGAMGAYVVLWMSLATAYLWNR